MLEASKGAVLAGMLAVLGGFEPVLQAIILIAAAGGALGWLVARILRPVAGAFWRTYMALGALEELPGFMERTEKRLDDGSANFAGLEQRMESLEADAAEAANAGRAVARELDVPVRHP